MTVLDMGAGGGYSTELMARAVAPNGKVYGQNARTAVRGPRTFRDTHADAGDEERRPWPARRTTIRFPPDVKDLDLITFFFAYHDTTYMPVDRAADEQEDVRRAQARRHSGHCRSCGEGRRRRHRRQDAASDRGEDAACARSRLPDSSSSTKAASCTIRTTRTTSRSSAADPGRRIRAEVPEAVMTAHYCGACHMQTKRAPVRRSFLFIIAVSQLAVSAGRAWPESVAASAGAC